MADLVDLIGEYLEERKAFDMYGSEENEANTTKKIRFICAVLVLVYLYF